MRGAKPKPTVTKDLQGTLQPCRTNEDEPMPTLLEGVECPEHLEGDEVARSTWNYYAPLLIKTRILSELDLDTLANFCGIVSDLRGLRKDIQEHGRLLYVEKMREDGSKYYDAKTNPACTQYNNLLTQFRGYSSNLGLDPTSRPRLKVEGKPEPEEEGILDV